MEIAYLPYLALSANADTIIAAFGQFPNYIKVSPDSGTTWYQANAPLLSGPIMSSADGKTFAEFSSGAIYLSVPPPSQPAALFATANLTNGVAAFQLTGQPGYTYAIQASTNLADWMTIATLVNTNGTVTFFDPSSTNYNQRFYRAVISP